MILKSKGNYYELPPKKLYHHAQETVLDKGTVTRFLEDYLRTRGGL